MEDEPLATAVQNMRKGSRGTFPDGQGGGGAAPREPPHLAGVP